MSDEAIAYQIPRACEVSGLSRTALYKLFNSGEIVPRKHRGRTLVLADDLRRYIESLPPGISPHLAPTFKRGAADRAA